MGGVVKGSRAPIVIYSSWNVRGKKGKVKMVGDKGPVIEGNGMVFVRGLGGRMSRFMRASIVLCVVTVAFWGAGLVVEEVECSGTVGQLRIS